MGDHFQNCLNYIYMWMNRKGFILGGALFSGVGTRTPHSKKDTEESKM